MIFFGGNYNSFVIFILFVGIVNSNVVNIIIIDNNDFFCIYFFF